MFENSIKSEHTRKTYLYHLNKFMKCFEIDDYDSLTAIGPERMQIMMEDYVMDLKKTSSASLSNEKFVCWRIFRFKFECEHNMSGDIVSDDYFRPTWNLFSFKK